MQAIPLHGQKLRSIQVQHQPNIKYNKHIQRKTTFSKPKIASKPEMEHEDQSKQNQVGFVNYLHHYYHTTTALHYENSPMQ